MSVSRRSHRVNNIKNVEKKPRKLPRNILDLLCLWLDKNSNDNDFHDFKEKEIS